MLKTLKTFYGFVLKKRLLFVVFVLLGLISAVLYSLNPFFYKLFVEAIPSLNHSRLLQILFIYTFVRVLAHAIEVFSMYLGDKILITSAAEARTTVFKYVQDLDFAFHSSKSTGSLISAFKRGDGAFFNLFVEIHYRIINVFVTFAVMSYFFFQIDKFIVLSVLGAFALSLIVAKKLVGFNVSKRNIFNDEEDKISGVITDNLINYETVKLFAKERAEYLRLKFAFNPWKKTLRNYQNSFRIIDVAIGTIINLSMFIILFMTLRWTVSTRLSVGDFVLITGFLSAFFPRLWDLVWGFRDIAKNFSDIEKYFGLLEHEIEVKDPEKPVKIDHVYGEIEFKNTSFSYKGRLKNAINGLSLKVEQGESVALVGRSGSGKSTLVKLLMRFYDVDSGEIMIDGINIKYFNKSTLRSFIGVVPQEPILFNNTIAYNIGYGKKKSTLPEIKAAAKLAYIDSFIESLPKKYQTQVGERGVKLSGGQKQRLAIARMILSEPDIVIFDEATSHLDSESEALIQEGFWKAAQGKTTIIIAHRLSTIMRADRIVVLENGKIKEMGSHKELIKVSGGLYKHFWDLQINID